MKRMDGGRIVAECLDKLGVEYYFGYNGHGIWRILEGLLEKPHIKGIQTKHEFSAVHMADGYFRAKHKVCPVLASVGPGALNLISAAGNAMLDSSGVLLIPTAPPTHYLDRSSLEELSVHAGDDVTSIFRPISKRVWYSLRPDILAWQIRQAYKLAGTGRPGPTTVYIPFDVTAHETEIDEAESFPEDTVSTKMGADPLQIKRATELFLKSKKPLLVAGGGVHLGEAWDEVKAFVEAFDIPLVTSMPGKGVLEEDHPLCLGPVGRSGWGCSVQATREADLILAVGCHFCDANTSGWRKGVVYNFPDTRLIHVNIDQMDIGRNYPADVGIVGDSKIVLAQIIASLKGVWKENADRKSWSQTARKWKQEWIQKVVSDMQGEENPVSTSRLAYEVSKAIPKDANIVTDTGDIQQAYEGLTQTLTRNTFFNNAGWAQMGWAASAVMGVKLARPNKAAVCICGDGSMIMANYAMGTAVEYNIPVVWVLINNYGQSIERHGQLANFGRETWSSFQIEKTGKLYNPDFGKMAEAYGVKAKKIHSSGEIKKAVQEAIQANEPYLIEVVTDRNSPTYFSPGVTRGYPVRWDKLAYLKQ
jgi:acetolactate synthase-1/2/3 large subunit